MASWVILCRFAADQLVFEGVRGRRGSARQIQLAEDVTHVAGDGLLADVKIGGDAAIGLAAGDETQYLEFAGREAVACARCR